jgi:hypothetical protein
MKNFDHANRQCGLSSQRNGCMQIFRLPARARRGFAPLFFFAGGVVVVVDDDDDDGGNDATLPSPKIYFEIAPEPKFAAHIDTLVIAFTFYEVHTVDLYTVDNRPGKCSNR